MASIRHRTLLLLSLVFLFQITRVSSYTINRRADPYSNQDPSEDWLVSVQNICDEAFHNVFPNGRLLRSLDPFGDVLAELAPASQGTWQHAISPPGGGPSDQPSNMYRLFSDWKSYCKSSATPGCEEPDPITALLADTDRAAREDVSYREAMQRWKRSVDEVAYRPCSRFLAAIDQGDDCIYYDPTAGRGPLTGQVIHDLCDNLREGEPSPHSTKIFSTTAVDFVDMTFAKSNDHFSKAVAHSTGSPGLWAFTIITKIGPWIFTIPAAGGFQDWYIEEKVFDYQRASQKKPKAPILALLICGNFGYISPQKWKFTKEMVKAILSGDNTPLVYIANINPGKEIHTIEIEDHILPGPPSNPSKRQYNIRVRNKVILRMEYVKDQSPKVFPMTGRLFITRPQGIPSEGGLRNILRVPPSLASIQ